jgi:hypothetical protein
MRLRYLMSLAFWYIQIVTLDAFPHRQSALLTKPEVRGAVYPCA